MNPEKIKKHDVMPRLAKRAIGALSDEKRRAVLLWLWASKKESVTFDEIQKEFEADRQTIRDCLHGLGSGGIIQNYYKRGPDGKAMSVYEVSPFGNDFMEAIYHAAYPEPVEITERIVWTFCEICRGTGEVPSPDGVRGCGHCGGEGYKEEK